MTWDPVHIDRLTEKIIACGIAVHRALGPALLESIYQQCMLIELLAPGLHVEQERHVTLTYRGHRVSDRLKIDLLVEGCVIVEIKAVERIHAVHVAQVITYLKLTGYPAGLLINFNTTRLKDGLRRLDHPDLYARKHPPGREL